MKTWETRSRFHEENPSNFRKNQILNSIDSSSYLELFFATDENLVRRRVIVGSAQIDGIAVAVDKRNRHDGRAVLQLDLLTQKAIDGFVLPFGAGGYGYRKHIHGTVVRTHPERRRLALHWGQSYNIISTSETIGSSPGRDMLHSRVQGHLALVALHQKRLRLEFWDESRSFQE